jgi:hypothetical protein
VTIALLAAIALLVWVAVRLYRKAPPKDWSFRVDVDKPTPVLDIPELRQPPLWIAPPFAEKLVLVGLIAAIYVSVLDVDASVVQIVIATSLIVGASIGVSQLLARRGIEWSSIGVQWLVLAAVNTVLIGTYAVLVGGSLNRSLAAFFGLLLTMVIVLYDRFLGERATRTDDPTVTPANA